VDPVRRAYGRLTEADVAVDDAGRLYVVGETNSTDFPTTPGAYDRECRDRSIPGPCIDAYVARFTTSGTHVATTMIGGNDSHETGTSVAIDRAGRPVIGGYVGAPMYGFPTTPGTYGETPEPSGTAAFVARFSADLAHSNGRRRSAAGTATTSSAWRSTRRTAPSSSARRTRATIRLRPARSTATATTATSGTRAPAPPTALRPR
jgi:hypothetical protein